MLPTRDEYRTLDTAELKRRYRAASVRSERASTNSNYLTDAFIMQELMAVLDERGVSIHR